MVIHACNAEWLSLKMRTHINIRQGWQDTPTSIQFNALRAKIDWHRRYTEARQGKARQAINAVAPRRQIARERDDVTDGQQHYDRTYMAVIDDAMSSSGLSWPGPFAGITTPGVSSSALFFFVCVVRRAAFLGGSRSFRGRYCRMVTGALIHGGPRGGGIPFGATTTCLWR